MRLVDCLFFMRVCVCVQTSFQHCTKNVAPLVSVFVSDGFKRGGVIWMTWSVQVVSDIVLFCKDININHIEIKSYNM